MSETRPTPPDAHADAPASVTSLSPDTDALLERCLTSAPKAWSEFFERYKGLIFVAIRRYGLPEEEAREAFQGAMIAIYRQLPELREVERLHSWIVSISCRKAIDQIRLRTSRPGRGRDVDLEEIDESAAPAMVPDEEHQRLVDAQRAREALAAVSSRCRELLTALFFEDPPADYRTLARKEGVKIGSIGGLRGRCLGQMRRFFEEQGWTE